MSTYPIDDLLHRWDRRELTPEQAIGHLLQHVETLTQRLAAAEKTIRRLEQRRPTKE
jgi:hypothetical protein